MPVANQQPLEQAAEEQGLRHLDALTQNRIRDLQGPKPPSQVLRRTGQRPFAFDGAVVAFVCGVTPVLPYWYELNVHRASSGGWVSDIRLFSKASDKPDLFRVEQHDDLDAVFAHFERYDPSADLEPGAAMLEAGGTNTQLALHTARLQMQLNRITDHFRALAGDLLNRLETAAR